MSVRRVLVVSLIACGLHGMEASAQDDVPARIAGLAETRGGAAAFLQRLTDEVGGRVTGTPACRAASELILTALREAGYADARFEEYPLTSRWTRGTTSVRLVAPIQRALAAGSYAWVPGTRGEVAAAPLVDLGAPASSDLDMPAARLRGAAVLVDPQKAGKDPSFVMRAALARRLAAAGAAAMLIPSDKPDRMVYTSAFGFFPRGPLPVLSIAAEDAKLLRRLPKESKAPVRLSIDVQNGFDESPYRERNVIADLRGSKHPDEIVLVGAHFDSWDPAQGADDDGSGVAAVLEAARILKSLGAAPDRTIRFAFFSGEEEGLLGSRAYVAAHEKELDRHRAVLVMDEGAQTPFGFHVQGRTDLDEPLRRLLAPLATLGAAGTSPDATFDQDHAPFLAVGVPAFALWVAPGDYDTRHHAVTDTFDHVDLRMLALDTAVMAIAARELANASTPVGRRLSASEAAALLERTGVESTRRMVYEGR